MKENFRTENDFLGSKELPSDAYYGINAIRGQENFSITGYSMDKTLINAIAIVKKAAALANRDIDILDEDIAEAIADASDEILKGNYHDQFIVDPIQGGAGTSFNMNANEIIANLALEKLGKEKGSYDIVSPNTHVNMAQSTNDAFPTAAHMSMLTKLNMLIETLNNLVDLFLKKSKEFDDVVKMGRTHLQDAIPIRLGQEFRAYSSVIKRDIVRLENTKANLQYVNMGATAVGTGLNADKVYIENVMKYLNDFSGLDLKLADDLVDATQNTDSYTELSSALKITMVNISKISNDLRLMASGPRAGLAEINLPPRQAGSSIMPGKINPVMLEVMNQIAFQVIGNDLTVSMASEAGQFELNVMEPVMTFNVLESMKIMRNGINAFMEYCIEGITANEEHLRDYVENSVGIITAINPHVGYDKSSAIAKEALNTGVPVRELVLKHNLLTEEELDIILDPFEMTKIGIPGHKLLKEKKNNKKK